MGDEQKAEVEHLCSREGCNNPSKLQCPTCLKQDIQGSYFCSQVWRLMLNLYILSVSNVKECVHLVMSLKCVYWTV